MARPALPPAFLAHPIAHRALHDAQTGVIENSPTAVRAAVAAGYGLEIDVQLTADGEAVVFHDDDLARLTHAEGAVRDRTLTEMKSLRLKGAQEGSAALADVLAIVAGRVPVLIELKDQSRGTGQAPPDLEGAVAAALRGYDGPVAVMSFNPAMVGAMAELAPDVPRGITSSAFRPADWTDLPEETCTHLRGIPDFDAVGACFISHAWRDLTQSRVSELKAAGVPILCWTVKSAAEEAIARQVADQITFEGYTPGNVA